MTLDYKKQAGSGSNVIPFEEQSSVLGKISETLSLLRYPGLLLFPLLGESFLPEVLKTTHLYSVEEQAIGSILLLGSVFNITYLSMDYAFWNLSNRAKIFVSLVVMTVSFALLSAPGISSSLIGLLLGTCCGMVCYRELQKLDQIKFQLQKRISCTFDPITELNSREIIHMARTGWIRMDIRSLQEFQLKTIPEDKIPHLLGLQEQEELEQTEQLRGVFLTATCKQTSWLINYFSAKKTLVKKRVFIARNIRELVK